MSFISNQGPILPSLTTIPKENALSCVSLSCKPIRVSNRVGPNATFAVSKFAKHNWNGTTNRNDPL